MTEPPRDPADPLEEVVLECIEADDVERALDEACARHPDGAAKIRRVASRLRSFGIAVSPDGDPEFRTLGPFELLEQLGEGGMGVVYRAWQDPPGREVALKVIRPQLLHFDGSRGRFEREIEAALKLSHPGIVPVFEVGTTAGVPWFSMALVDGRSLSDVLASLRGRTPAQLCAEDLTRGGATGTGWVDAVVECIRSVGDALEHAHERGVVHRDVKPSNVMIASEGGAMLLDFGLARTEGSAQQLTQSHAMVGSLPYMPPESLRGGASRLGAEADVYSLGVTLYEALTLRSPFLGPTAEATRTAVLRSQPDNPRRLNPRISRSLETVCLTAMADEPSRRYRTVSEFVLDLGHVAAGRPIVASPDGWLDHGMRFVRRNRVVVTATLAVILALAAGVVVSLQLFFKAEADRRLAERRSYVATIASAESAVRARRTGEASERLRSASPAWRGWEWRHLVARLDGSKRTFSLTSELEHRRVSFARVVDDAAGRRTFVAVRTPGYLTVLDAMDPTEAVGLIKADRVDAFALAPGGEHVIWSDGAAILVGSIASGEERRIPQAGCTVIAVAADGAEFAAADRFGRIGFYDVATGVCRTRIATGDRLSCLAFSADGGLLAAGGSNRRVHVFDCQSRDRLHLLGGHGARVELVAFGPGGRRLVSTSADGRVHMWSMGRGDRIGFPVALDAAIHGLAFAENGREVALAAGESIVLLSTRTGQELGVLLGHRGPLLGVDWVDRSESLVTVGTDATLRQWHRSAIAEPRVSFHGAAIERLAQSPDGRYVVAVALDGLTRVLDAESGTLAFDAVTVNAQGMRAVGFSADGTRLALVRSDRMVILAVESWAIQVDLDASVVARPRTLVFSRDDEQVVVGGDDEFVVVDSKTLEVVHRSTGFGRIHQLRLAPGGDRLALATERGAVLLDCADWSESTRWSDSECYALAFAGDGRVAIADAEGLSVLGVRDGTVWNHYGSVQVFDLVFEANAPDPRLFLAGADGAIHVLAGEVEVAKLHASNSELRALTVLADGTLLVSGDQLGELRFWTAPRAIELTAK